MNRVIFWGATGQARVLREAMLDLDTTLLALFDNQDIPSPFPDIPIFRGEAGFSRWERDYSGERPVYACVAIAGGHGVDRIDRMRWLKERGYSPMTVIHPRAFVASGAVLGEGCQILAMSAICASVKLGSGVIVNTKASVDHDSVVGDGVHIAPGASLAGEITVGNFAFIGTGAVVLPHVSIGRHATIGAGAVVTKNVGAGEIVLGNPARPVRKD